jgi:hypothetical protein
LIIDLIGVANFELVRLAADRVTNRLARRYGHVNTMTDMKRAQLVAMRQYSTAGLEFRRHRS